VKGLQNINLGLNFDASDNVNPKLWNCIYLHIEGATGKLDNIAVRVGARPSIES